TPLSSPTSTFAQPSSRSPSLPPAALLRLSGSSATKTATNPRRRRSTTGRPSARGWRSITTVTPARGSSTVAGAPAAACAASSRRRGRYEGGWVDGKYDGHGIETWARGSRYWGQYHKGLRHGFGVFIFYNGDGYVGEWVGGQSHGVGLQRCSDGSRYSGDFKAGVKHGLGCYHFR
ncbi:hypothetical protein B296_00040041, partial [Ensete ventricosum]